jgi:hypothetical protein
MNGWAPTEDESGDSKDSFCEELEQLFDNFPKYHKNSVGFHKKGDDTNCSNCWGISLLSTTYKILPNIFL